MITKDYIIINYEDPMNITYCYRKLNILKTKNLNMYLTPITS